SIRSYQGIDDDQSSFHFVNQSAAFGLVPSYEAQLLQSSAYQRAEKVAADELLTRKIELLSEKYALEEKLEGLLLDMDLKDEKLAELENAALLKDKKVTQLENAALLKDKKVTQLENDISSKDEKVTQLEQDILLKLDRIGILERDIFLKNEHLFSKNERIPGLESSSVQKAELKGLGDDGAVDWCIENWPNQLLRSAAGAGYVKLTRALLEKSGADMEDSGPSEMKPLHAAVSGGHVEVVKMLSEKGANMEATAAGRTPLHYASKGGHVEIEEAWHVEGARTNPFVVRFALNAAAYQMGFTAETSF
ncbi:hypothetical protein MMC31_003004, partial [Peltigera leucophlebia]|nr:hypothetical protein [Peltigera leucophlebia]